MIGKGPHRCRSCQAMLRHGHSGTLCDPCAHTAPLVPPGFFDTPVLRAALKRYDFGPVFRAVRSVTGLSQEALGDQIYLPQGLVSRIETGAGQLRRLDRVVRVANRCGIHVRFFGFEPDTYKPTQEEKVSPVYDRRGLFGFASALTLGALATVALDFERLATLVPDSGSRTVRRQIGADDVRTIRGMTAVYRAADFRHGGGLAREAAIALLGSVMRMRQSRCTEQVRTELRLATAELGAVAGRMSCDVELHEDARQWWLVGLGAARESNHELATDMMVAIQLELASQSFHLRNPEEALSFARLAEMTAANGDHPVSAQTRTYISLRQATCQAMLGKADLCQRALDQGQERAGGIDPTAAPPWSAYVIPAEITAVTGSSMYRLAQHERGYAPKAVEPLLNAINTYGDEYARSRALYLPSLAGTYFQVGDLDAAVATGHRAVTEISALSSTRIHDRLRTLTEVAQPYNHRSDVAELRHRIHQTVTTAA
jgi:hypothetical protein